MVLLTRCGILMPLIGPSVQTGREGPIVAQKRLGRRLNSTSREAVAENRLERRESEHSFLIFQPCAIVARNESNWARIRATRHV